MFINYIEFELKLKDQMFSKKNLTLLSTNKYGWTIYSFGLEKKLQLHYHQKEDKIKIEGSLPYFLNGHTFYSNLEETRKAIILISYIIKLDISGAIVKTFDFVTVIHTSASPSSVFLNHVSLDDFFIRTSKNGKLFINPNFIIKLYDAKQILKAKVKKEVQDQLRQKGIYDPSFSCIQFEVRYRKPALVFYRPIKVTDIIEETFIDLLKTKLEDQYSRIEVIGEFLISIDEDPINLKEMKFYISNENELSAGISGVKRIEELLDILYTWEKSILN